MALPTFLYFENFSKKESTATKINKVNVTTVMNCRRPIRAQLTWFLIMSQDIKFHSEMMFSGDTLHIFVVFVLSLVFFSGRGLDHRNWPGFSCRIWSGLVSQWNIEGWLIGGLVKWLNLVLLLCHVRSLCLTPFTLYSVSSVETKYGKGTRIQRITV